MSNMNSIFRVLAYGLRVQGVQCIIATILNLGFKSMENHRHFHSSSFLKVINFN